MSISPTPDGPPIGYLSDFEDRMTLPRITLADQLLKAKHVESSVLTELLDELVSQARQAAKQPARAARQLPRSWRVKDDTTSEECLELCQNILVRETAEEFCALGNLAKEPEFEIEANPYSDDDIKEGLLIHRVCPKGKTLSDDDLQQELSDFRSTLFIWKGRLCLSKQPYVNCPCREASSRGSMESASEDELEELDRLGTSQDESVASTSAEDIFAAAASPDAAGGVPKAPGDDLADAVEATSTLKCLLHPKATLQLPCCVGPSVGPSVKEASAQGAFVDPSVMNMPPSRVRKLFSLATMLTTLSLLDVAREYLTRRVEEVVDEEVAALKHWLGVFCRPQRRELCPQLQPQPSAMVADPSQDVSAQVVADLRHELEVVQGPPGTGKSTLLSRAINRCSEAAFTPSTVRSPQSHATLIIAVQNKACENVLRRLVEDETFTDEEVLVLGTERNADRLGPLQFHCLMQSHQSRDSFVKYFLHEFQKPQSPARHKKMLDYLEKALRQVEQRLYRTAKIVVATLDSVQPLLTSKRMMHLRRRIKCIFCDEAGTIPECRLPTLSFFLPKFVLMVGDTKQLPPFTRLRSDNAQDPLPPFARMEKCLGQAGVHMLTQQYRSHPAISDFVSENFYGGCLHPHESVYSRVCKPGLEYFEGLRYEVTHSDGDHQELTVEELGEISQPNWMQRLCKEALVGVARTSYLNLREALAVKEQLTRILSRVASAQRLASDPSTSEEAPAEPSATVDVITFYKAQVHVLETLLFDEIKRGAELYNMRIEVKTVDAAQGSEADVVILSPVRCHARTGYKTLGFLHDERRLNVACSRARYALIVVGCLSYEHGCVDKHRIFREFVGLAKRSDRVLQQNAMPEQNAMSEDDFFM
ncbi:uncharacterized protein MONBRDRAFT_6568 [Monosiga brevicollis MX1]|uniref:Uncharacterized protein n=1 Tax=Monosiga brevicollis TaxID=81824 RepID=A9UU97_MONBE|nr:uncharacterized protein MONBRDRAFT_6568 [Monosiga brevicollis MX1]EDQ91385.1 predicted protein [Monosiga brevicollis MX1]|eukprot:XP_001743807.1 hypothetical protein [Monosiga brevicollis MX1]